MIVIGVVNSDLPLRPPARLGRHEAGLSDALLGTPRPSQSGRRRVFERGELEQTIASADEPYRTLFTLAALTGARLSELLGLT